MSEISANNIAIHSENSSQVEGFAMSDMAELLAHHFGDGIVYLPAGDQQNSLYSVAVENAYINEEGYLTRKGRIFLATNSDGS